LHGLLEVSSLAVERGGLPVLSGISFSLSPGTALVLRGPNGVGKTSLIRTIAGLQPPSAGSLLSAEAVYAGHLDGVKAQLTVAENLHFWAEVCGRRGIDAALAAFDLERLADRPARALSAGQRRRLGLARLILAHRPLWLLDEPTVSLDDASLTLFGNAVQAHLAAGGGAVIATHVELGLQARVLDLSRHRAAPAATAFGGDW
jgi:heme exporter protein A